MAAGRGKLCSAGPGHLQPLGWGMAGHGGAQGTVLPAGHSQPSTALGGGSQPTEQLSAPSGRRTAARAVITDGL